MNLDFLLKVLQNDQMSMIRVSVTKLLENPESPVGLNELIDLVDSILKEDDFINLNVSGSSSQASMEIPEECPPAEAKGAHSSTGLPSEKEEISYQELMDAGEPSEKKSEKSSSSMPAPRRGISLHSKHSKNKSFLPNFEAGFSQIPTEEVRPFDFFKTRSRT